MQTTKGQQARKSSQATDGPEEAKNLTEQSLGQNLDDDYVEVPLESLSEMTGFPIEFIKKELLLDGKNVSLGDLRQSIVQYLESNAGDFQNI